MPAAPLDKSAKYDRQLRLWAANGQIALEKCRVCLINGTATGTETLKNLVLPGIGAYTIIDDRTITAEDAGNNFFLDADCIGASRAAKTCAYLQELNSDVRGDWLDVDPVSLIHKNPQHFVDSFDAVLVTDLHPTPLLALSKTLWAAQVPLFVVDSAGFYGSLRICAPEHTIVETHPDAIVDLRLDVPWPELASLAGSMDMDTMNDNEHTHTPYILLLLHYLDSWKLNHNGSPPTTFDEKAQFKDMIRKGMRNADEENFDEAISNVWRACGKTSVPSYIQSLFSQARSQILTATTPTFWFLVRALADFVEREGAGLLPVSGTVPDMKSDTTRYIALQHVYHRQSQRDVTHLKAHLMRHLSEAGRPSDCVTDEEIATFAKHAGYIKVITYRSHEDEIVAPRTDLLEQAAGESESLVFQYCVTRAARVAYEETGVYPGASTDASSDALQGETDALFARTRALFPTLHDGVSGLRDVCAECVRAGGSELHNTASFMGGLAAQELIKVVTRQYVPINNTVLFDGITSRTAVFEF